MRWRLAVLMLLSGAWAVVGCGLTPTVPTDAPTTGSVNPVREGELTRTVAIEILELDESQGSGGYMQRPAIVAQEVIGEIVAALDRDLPLGPRVRTPARYRLRFVREDGVVVELGYRADPGNPSFLRGDQDFWQGGDAKPSAGFKQLMAEQFAAMPPDAGEEEPPGPSDPARARDAALAYLAEAYGQQVPTPGLAWAEEDVTPEGLVGAAGRRYTAGDSAVTVRYPVVAPEAVIYQVTVENEASGFRWAGQMDAWMRVLAASPGVVGALEVALAHIGEQHAAEPPAVGMGWLEENITPGYPEKPVPGWMEYRFTAGPESGADEWVVVIGYPVLPPEQIVYEVTVDHRATGFHWEGQVDARGAVTEP